MSAEITIRFEGDAAALNALSNPQPIPAPQPPREDAKEEAGRFQSGLAAAREIAGALGGPVASVVDRIVNSIDQVRKISESLQGAMGFDSPTAQVPAQILTGSGQKAATQAALRAATTARTTAAGAAGGEAAAGGAAAAGGGAILAGLVNPFTVAVAGAVVAVGLFAAAVKQSIDVLDVESEKLAGLTPAIAQAKSIMEMNRDLRLMQRGDELGSPMVRFMQMRDRFDAKLSEAWTDILRVLLEILNTLKPVAEGAYDLIAEAKATAVEAAALRARIEAAITKGTADDAVANVLSAIAKKFRKEANEGWATDNLGGSDDLEKQSKDMAQRLVESFGTGRKAPPIPPSR